MIRTRERDARTHERSYKSNLIFKTDAFSNVFLQVCSFSTGCENTWRTVKMFSGWDDYSLLLSEWNKNNSDEFGLNRFFLRAGFDIFRPFSRRMVPKRCPEHGSSRVSEPAFPREFPYRLRTGPQPIGIAWNLIASRFFENRNEKPPAIQTRFGHASTWIIMSGGSRSPGVTSKDRRASRASAGHRFQYTC